MQQVLSSSFFIGSSHRACLKVSPLNEHQLSVVYIVKVKKLEYVSKKEVTSHQNIEKEVCCATILLFNIKIMLVNMLLYFCTVPVVFHH